MAPRIGQIQKTIVPSELGSSKNQTVEEVQTALKQLGFDTPTDGFFNQQTQDAVRKFQQRSGIDGKGEINQETVAALNKQLTVQERRKGIVEGETELKSPDVPPQSAKSKGATSNLRASTVQLELSDQLPSSPQLKSTQPSGSSIPPSIDVDSYDFSKMPPLPATPSPPSSPRAGTSTPPPTSSATPPSARPRRDAYGQSTIPEQAIDQRAPMERFLITKQKGATVEKSSIDTIQPDQLSGEAKKEFKEYSKLAGEPLRPAGPERQQQFEKMEGLLRNLSQDEKQGASFKKEHNLLRETFKDDRLMSSSHLTTPAHAMEMKRLGLHPTIAGRVGQFTDDHLKGKMKTLGTGQFNEVVAGKYKLEDKEIFKGVFKSEHTGEWNAKAADAIGIDSKNPRGGYRNVATSRLDEALQFGVTTRSEMAIHQNTLGTVSEKAAGKSPLGDEGPTNVRVPDSVVADIKKSGGGGKGWMEEYNQYADNPITTKDGKNFYFVGTAAREFDFNNAGLRRDLIRLQLMDSIAGQGDRHQGNYFVHFDGKEYKGLKGIDNDISWGKSLKTFDNSDSGMKDYQRGSLHLPRYLPPVIDQGTKDAILGLSDKTFSEKMGGLLTTEEMNAALARLKLVKAHISDDKKCKTVASHEQLSEGWVTDLLTKKVDGHHTSYIARELEFQQKAKERGLLIGIDK